MFAIALSTPASTVSIEWLFLSLEKASDAYDGLTYPPAETLLIGDYIGISEQSADLLQPLGEILQLAKDRGFHGFICCRVSG